MADEPLLEVARRWIAKAGNDLEIVNRDMDDDLPLTDILCFHCQQSVEKYLKAYLVSKGIKPPKTHLIGDLIDMCAKIDSEFKSLDDVVYLGEFAVDVRYPDDFQMPPIAQLKKAHEDAKRVRDFVVGKIRMNV